jgi:outer membrane murein-binding lipoprotein Lpp
MDLLDLIFNKLFGTNKEIYAHGKDNIQKCHKRFAILTKEDSSKISLKVFLYFFPAASNSEINSEELWFMKYNDKSKYDEYDFAIQLLLVFINFLSDKDTKSFDSKVIKIAKQFGEYKFVDTYLEVILLNNIDVLIAIIAYLTKDATYFKDFLKIVVNPEEIQTLKFIDNISGILANKNGLFNLENKMKTMEENMKILEEKIKILEENGKKSEAEMQSSNTLIQNLQNQIKSLQTDKENMKGEIQTLKTENLELKKRLDQLELKKSL